MKIGVFDSGIGGLSVAEAIERQLPDHSVLFRRDSAEHFPYGGKSASELLGYVTPILTSMVNQEGCDVLVIACNTVSTTLSYEITAQFPDVPIVFIVPMIKTAAAMTRTGKIIVCATPTTLASPRYSELKRDYAGGLQVIEPDCADWSTLIERNDMSAARIDQAIRPGLAAGADVIVLGCTHYHWIDEDVQALAGDDIRVLQPESSVIAHLQRTIEQLH